jgi:uncharacterized short protein YbdD (DUF466 family)
MKQLWYKLSLLWQFIRHLTGDNAYERYLIHHQQHHTGNPLSRKEFIKYEQQRKWSGIRRCC